jgi:hypothetical protein
LLSNKLEFEPLYRKEFLAVGSSKYNFGGVQQLSNMSFLLWVLTNHGLPSLAWFLHLDTLGIDVPPHPPPKFRNGDDHYSTEDSGTYLKWLFDFMQALDEKVIIFKKKRRKNYRRTTGHRQVSLSLYSLLILSPVRKKSTQKKWWHGVVLHYFKSPVIVCSWLCPVGENENKSHKQQWVLLYYYTAIDWLQKFSFALLKVWRVPQI